MKKAFRDNRMSLSVRELVEWVIREGDIDNRYAGPAREDAMLLGANAHRRLQKAAGGDYHAEVPVSYTAELLLDGKEPFFLTVDGRADGVIEGTGEDGMPALTRVILSPSCGLTMNLSYPASSGRTPAAYPESETSAPPAQP